MILLLVLVRAHAGIWRWIPGLLLFGAGVGTMLTSSVNVVQSSFPDQRQRKQRRVGRGDPRPPSTCSPQTSAYSSASQYTSNVTTTEITSAAVDRWAPAVSRIAAVMMAPYIPAARRRRRFFVVGSRWLSLPAAMPAPPRLLGVLVPPADGA